MYMYQIADSDFSSHWSSHSITHIYTHSYPMLRKMQNFYLLFHVVHPLVLWSHLSTLQSETSKHSKAKRVQDHSLTTEFKRCVHQWAHSTLSHTHNHSLTHRHMDSQGQGERWGLAWRERNDRLRQGERRREGKKDGNPKNGTTF